MGWLSPEAKKFWYKVLPLLFLGFQASLKKDYKLQKNYNRSGGNFFEGNFLWRRVLYWSTILNVLIQHCVILTNNSGTDTSCKNTHISKKGNICSLRVISRIILIDSMWSKLIFLSATLYLK